MDQSPVGADLLSRPLPCQALPAPRSEHPFSDSAGRGHKAKSAVTGIRLQWCVWPGFVYLDVLNLAMSMTASDGSFAALLDVAVDSLNASQSGDFADLDEASQIAALQSVESQPFFAAIQMNVGVTFYYHPAVWALLGYEGPSFDKGGYLHRGSGDIDWLPEDK